MSPEFWKKVKEAFSEAIDLSNGERRTFLESLDDDEVRRKVAQMIAEDEKDLDATAHPVINLSSLWGSEKQDNLVGAQIGDYQIVREIGRGGMGVAFEVTHTTEDVVQHVALKILRRGMDSEALLRSFQNERRILASLEHQHIVRLLGAGMTDDGLPYYTMELVDGKAIDKYVTENDLDLEARLNLFQQICSAVTYAHGKLVVHRDLKPSNVLVTPDGNVKLLDFGIAKDISLDRKGVEGTATRLGIMTPRYAAPEQIRGETVSVASDVYSLGVILYELLTGVSPYDLSSDNPLEIARIISETEPPKPSTAVRSGRETGKHSQVRTQNPHLKGDLDTIIIKALQKIPSRRYVSVEQFSNDISRYLKGMPITARPDTFRYRAEKFIKRNRLSVGALALVVMALLVGASVAAWQAVLVQKQRAFALRRFAEIRVLANKAVFRYLDEFSKVPGAKGLSEELAKDALTYMDSLAQEDLIDGLIRLELGRAYRKIGDVLGKPYVSNLGRSDDALICYQKSVAVLEHALKLEPESIEVKKELFLSLLSQAQMGVRVEKAKQEEILERSQKLHDEIGSTNSDLSEIADRQANIYMIRADVMEVSVERLAIYQKAYDLLRNVPDKTFEARLTYGRSVQRIGSNYIWLGNQATASGDKDQATKYYKLALPFHQQYAELANAYDDDAGSPTAERRIAMANQHLGEAYVKLNDFKLGFEMLNKSLSQYQVYLNKNPDNIESQIDISNCYFTIANAYEASNDLHRSIELNQKGLGILNKAIAIDANSESVRRKFAKMYKLIDLFQKTNQPKQAQSVTAELLPICSKEANKQFCRDL